MKLPFISGVFKLQCTRITQGLVKKKKMQILNIRDSNSAVWSLLYQFQELHWVVAQGLWLGNL